MSHALLFPFPLSARSTCHLISRSMAEEAPPAPDVPDAPPEIDAPAPDAPPPAPAPSAAPAVGAAAAKPKAARKWAVVETPTERPWLERYPLHAAAQGGDESALTALLADGPYSARWRSALDDDGWSPLHYAGWYNHSQCVRRLIAAGADAAAVSRDKRSTPLHFAAGTGALEVVRVLGSDAPRAVQQSMTMVDAEGLTPVGLTRALKPANSDAIVALLTPFALSADAEQRRGALMAGVGPALPAVPKNIIGVIVMYALAL
jgi:hypothetical protein